MFYQLSPSDLTFLWDECPRCFYLKVVHKYNRPWSPFPSIFNRIDKIMKDYYEGKPTSSISFDLPEGVIRTGEKWVKSIPITYAASPTSAQIRGKFDATIAFSDGSYGVIDFKTSEPKKEHVDFYSRQLHAYAYALENAASGSYALNPITRLGLLCVEPVSMDLNNRDQIAYLGNVTWLECPLDYNNFFSFLEGVLQVLDDPSPPESNENCNYCRYRDSSRTTGF